MVDCICPIGTVNIRCPLHGTPFADFTFTRTSIEAVVKQLTEENKGLKVALLSALNDQHNQTCPFCHGTGFSSSMKGDLRDDVLRQWSLPITWDELDDYNRKKYG